MRCSNCGNDLPGGVRFCPKCGAPASPSATSPFSPPQATVSFGDQARAPLSGGGMMQQQKKKSGCGKALLIFAIIGVLLAAVLGGLAYYGYHFASDKLKSSEAYTVAVAALKENPQAAEKLGAITETGFPLGSFKEEGSGGAAAYHMSVKGTKSGGTYDVVMSRRAGKWYLTTGRLKLDSGETINLNTPDVGMLGGDPSDGNSNTSSMPGRMGAGKIVAGGMLAGKATSMPQPAYPPAAKAVKASGAVVVLVVADEDGEVESAKAFSGHPLLRASAEAAAKQARFTPMVVAGKPVKMTGTITYNFVAQ